MIKNKSIIVSFYTLLLSAIAFIPQSAMAAAQNFQQLAGQFYEILSTIVPIILALTLIVFLWGIFKLVQSSNEDARSDAIKVITFGIIALFVMVSVWGLVAILTNTVFGNSQTFIPQLK